jgi:glycosyltransferase involved in cell wall biosynthesis
LIHVGHLRDLRPFYNGIDVFVNTSREEACSISVIESLACGCPVVGYPSTSVDEQVLPSGGEIVKQDDVKALTAAMQAWVNAPDRLEQARIGARQRAGVFNIETLSEQLWDEYAAVLGESTR